MIHHKASSGLAPSILFSVSCHITTILTTAHLSILNQGWVTVFNGQETIWTSTTMVPAADYEVRVLGLNYQGTPGEASPAVTFTTLSRDDKGLLGYMNADSQFSIECSGAVCSLFSDTFPA